MSDRAGRVALVWRAAPDTPPAETRNYARLLPVLEALREVGVGAEAVLYSTEQGAAVREELCHFDGVLVWVDPISDGEDRSALDELLQQVSARGTWVSTHPDTIEKMGTKEVLYCTRHLGWGTDTALYETIQEFVAEFPSRLTAAGPRVLKQNRGNGGIGVWKVTPLDDGATSSSRVRVQHAAPRDDTTEELTLGEFMARCTTYLQGGGKLLDQPYVDRVTDGMIRAYLVGTTVVGYARQQPEPSADGSIATGTVLGMPSTKTMFDADTPTFAALRSELENAWVPGMCAALDLSAGDLPVVWDADFLYGPKVDETDTYVLCEINVSSVLPLPPAAPRAIAHEVRNRLG